MEQGAEEKVGFKANTEIAAYYEFMITNDKHKMLFAHQLKPEVRYIFKDKEVSMGMRCWPAKTHI